MKPLEKEDYIEVVRAALKEDVGSGDVTAECLGLGDRRALARIIAKEDGIICGLAVAAAVFGELDPSAAVVYKASDGELVHAGTGLMEITGGAAPLLTGERTALNFLQRLSGIATFAYRASKMVKGMKAGVYDTRKTTPGMRILEKYAVRCGGGRNHRFGLFDMVLLKDNHVALAGGTGAAVRIAKENTGGAFVEVEVATIAQAAEAVMAGADRVMLDNMSLVQIEEAVKLIGGRAEIEVSGGVDLLTLSEIAAMGVDVISMGALTHSAQALDVAMYFHPE